MFINPKTDFAFKKIFGSEQSKDILISFLNAMLYDGQDTIVDLQLLDPSKTPRLRGIKDSFLDIKVQLHNKRTVIIEMQILNILLFDKRVLYNAAKAFSIQLDAGESYAELNPVVALTIADFELFPGSSKVISSYSLTEKDGKRRYGDDIELVFVELPKFKKTLEELESLSDKWIYFLRYANQLKEMPRSMEIEPALEHAFDIARQIRLNPEEIEILEWHQRVIHDNVNAILYAEQQGLEEGRKWRQKKEMAKQLFDVLDLETIAQKTGLTLEELRSLQKNE